MDWEVRLIDDYLYMGKRLVLFRRGGLNRIEYITGWDEYGSPIIQSVEENRHLDVKWPLLPNGVAEDIAEQIKPGPTRGEVKRLEESLDIERDRVNRILERHINVQ